MEYIGIFLLLILRLRDYMRKFKRNFIVAHITPGATPNEREGLIDDEL